MVGKEESIKAVLYNTEAFVMLCENETAFKILTSSETAVNCLVKHIQKATKIENVIGDFKADLEDIETKLPALTDEPVADIVSDTQNKVSETLEKLKDINSNTDILLNSINALFNSEACLKNLASNTTVSMAIANNQDCINALYDHRVTTYKYITQEWELGKALLNSNLKKNVSARYNSQYLYISTGFGSDLRYAYINTPKIILLTTRYSMIKPTEGCYINAYNLYNGTDFATKKISNATGSFNIGGFCNGNNRTIFESFSPWEEGHNLSAVYIPVTK